MHSFVKFHLELVLRGKFNVASFHCAQINFLNFNSVGDDHVAAHYVDEWLSHDGWCKTAHIHSINVAPKVLFLLLVLTILDTSNIHVDLVREHFSSFNKVLVSCP